MNIKVLFHAYLTRTTLQILLTGEEAKPPEWFSKEFGYTEDDLDALNDMPKQSRLYADLNKKQMQDLADTLSHAGNNLYGERFTGHYSGMRRYDNSAYSMPVNEAKACWRAGDRIREQIEKGW